MTSGSGYLEVSRIMTGEPSGQSSRLVCGEGECVEEHDLWLANPTSAAASVVQRARKPLPSHLKSQQSGQAHQFGQGGFEVTGSLACGLA
jgi:hypothetical protein